MSVSNKKNIEDTEMNQEQTARMENVIKLQRKTSRRTSQSQLLTAILHDYMRLGVA